MQRQRRGERRREQRPVAVERRSGERRTGIDVREISGDQAPDVLARALEETALTPLEQALFELVHAYGAAWAAEPADPRRARRGG